jgi:hypothetical protein
VVSRLALDAVWRNRQLWLWMAMPVSLIWIFAGLGLGPASQAVATSLAFAYVLGSIGPVATLGLRELRTLPVTNRDLWVATWVTSAVIALGLTVVQTLTVIGVTVATDSRSISAETLLLASLYCLSYSAALLPIMPAMGYSFGNIGARRPRWLWITLSTASVLIFVGAFGLPFYFAEALPLTLSRFTWGAALALAGCLTLAGFSLAWTPQRGGIARATGGTQPQARSTARHQLRSIDGLKGIPRIALPLVIAMLMVCAGTVAGFVAFWAMFASGTSLRLFMQNNALLLFETGLLPRPDTGSLWVILALAFITTATPWKAFARQLKVLPMATHQVNALLLLTPFAQWALIWLALVITHVAVIGGPPSSLRLEIFVLVAGISALGHGMMFRYGHRGSLWMIMLMGVLTPAAGRLAAVQWSLRVEAIVIAIGLVALGAAAWVNHRTLTRCTSSATVYGPESLPFGVGSPGAPR